MPDNRYHARLSIAFVGHVATGAQTHTNSDIDGGSWVSVRTGPILSYCEYPDHVIARATAWNSAMLKARHILPADSDQPRIRVGVRDVGRVGAGSRVVFGSAGRVT